MSSIKIETDSGILKFDIDLFDNEDELDLNSLLKIDYNKILEEKITFPIVVSRFGVMLSNAEKELRQEELNYRIWKSKKKTKIRDKWDKDPERPLVRGSKYTKDEVEDAVVQTKIFKKRKMRLNKLEFEKDVLNTLYWQAKEKLDRLEKINYDIEAKKALKVKSFNGIKVKQIKN